jgi:hypothetical protein
MVFGSGTTYPTFVTGFKYDFLSGDARINGITVGKGPGNYVSNTVLGYLALSSNTSTTNYSTAVGYEALKANTSGWGNSGIGAWALSKNTTGINNTGLGAVALYENTTGNRNVAVGYQSLQRNTTGIQNTSVGMNSMSSVVSGNNNTGIAYQSLLNLTTGSNNTVIGYNSGNGITTGSDNTILGGNISGLTAALANNIILADGQGNIKYRWDGTTNTITGDLAVTGVLRPTVTTNRQVASYTLVLTDRGKLVEMNVATANNLTIPLDSAVAFPIGTLIEIAQYGAGQTTIVATGGVTIRSASGNLKIASQYVAISLIKIGTNEWYAFGNLSA